VHERDRQPHAEREIRNNNCESEAKVFMGLLQCLLAKNLAELLEIPGLEVGPIERLRTRLPRSRRRRVTMCRALGRNLFAADAGAKQAGLFVHTIVTNFLRTMTLGSNDGRMGQIAAGRARASRMFAGRQVGLYATDLRIQELQFRG